MNLGFCRMANRLRRLLAAESDGMLRAFVDKYEEINKLNLELFEATHRLASNFDVANGNLFCRMLGII